MKKLVVITSLLVTVGLAGPALAQTCVVTNNSGGTGSGSLGYCINQANVYPGPFTIFFQIPNTMAPDIVADNGYVITNSRGVVIDGYSQPGASPNTNPAPQPLNTRLMVSVSVNPDTSIWRGAAVFDIRASNVTIRGLNIQGGPLYAVAICYQTGGPSTPCHLNHIQGNFIGTDITGTQPRPSGWLNWNPPYGAGVYLGPGAVDNFIGILPDGSNDEAERNLISGQVPAPSPGGGMIGHGVLIDGISDAPQNTRIIGNLIGTTVDVSDVLPNNYGITMLGSADYGVITGNVIAGNNLDGIWSGAQAGSLGGVVQNFSIMANAIGIDPNTDNLLPNGEDGIHIEGATQDFTIGVIDNWNLANVISGNTRHGIYINGNYQIRTRGNGIFNNVIGLDTSGASAGNGEAGIMVEATISTNFIGDTPSSGGNVISGNGGSGIYLLGAASTSIQGNWIGRNLAGDTPRPNGGNGITLACTDIACCNATDIWGNDIRWNGENGVALYGPSTNTSIANDNDISQNTDNGILAMVADSSNVADSNIVSGNGAEGLFLVGSSLEVTNNTIEGNGDWGVASIPYYGSTQGPAGAGDDVVGDSSITGNSILNNASGGIISQDTEPRNGTTLGSDNTIGDNNGNLDVLQAWFGAVEILDDATPPNPITSGSYQVNLSDALGYSLDGSTPDGGLWGPDGGGNIPAFTYDDVYTWFFVPAYLVDNGGTFHQANPWTVTVVGPTSGQSVYTFDGVNNDTNLGGQPAGILTGNEFRYQVAEVVTYPDSDQDGVPDTEDCAPQDANYQGPAGVPCDADTDGYCDDNISGQVQRAFCPNDCLAVMCTPTDCDDSNAAVNPGASEGPFGAAVCQDAVDNDCDGAVDMDDSGCWQCAADADCDDSDVCTGQETCVNHVCQAGTALDCDDNNTCTTDSCDPSAGCQHTYNTEPCDDGLYCTVSDTCDGAGHCVGQERDCSAVADQCNDGVCDENQSSCVQQPVQNGTSCDDGDVCTMNDSCQDGVCDGEPLDQDGDGYVAELCNGDDCDDSLAAVNPGATEGPAGDATCTDGLDNDCDSAVDSEDTGCVVVEQCGDGVRTGSEACDDGNTDAGDGCDASCQVEAGWACRTTVEPNLCGTAGSTGDLVITEIMQNPSCVADADGEWIELVNVSGHDIVLRGWSLADEDSDSHVVTDAVTVADGAYLVLCRNADSTSNGNVACDYQYANDFTLGNASDEVIVGDPGDTMVDTVIYDDGATFPDPNGASMSLDPNATDAGANDNGANWCEATSAIPNGCGDLGTPGAANPACSSCPDDDGDGHQAASCGGDDCDDNDAAVNPEADEVACDGKDNDCSEATPDDSDPTDSDADGFSVGCGQDCDDGDASIHPGAEEICGDDIDQDCNGSDLPCDCPDADSDGFFDANCGGSDCDDADSSVNPGASEIACDGKDNDCNGATADDPDPSDADGDGFSLGCGQDCNDGDAAIHPGAEEICEDDIDQDCNGSDLQCDCPDSDNDGFFDAACGGSDCDDNDGDIHPDAEEVCDGADNNCDGSTDEGFGQLSCGTGACLVTVEECLDGQPQQCQPEDPPEPTEQTCGDQVDNDCDGLTDADDEDCQGCADADGDGFQDAACGGDDCDDGDESVHPGAEELCTDGIDNDCNGLTDFDDSEVCKRSSSGCGCATDEPRAAGWLLLALLVLGRRRRRRARS